MELASLPVNDVSDVVADVTPIRKRKATVDNSVKATRGRARLAVVPWCEYHRYDDPTADWCLDEFLVQDGTDEDGYPTFVQLARSTYSELWKEMELLPCPKFSHLPGNGRGPKQPDFRMGLRTGKRFLIKTVIVLAFLAGMLWGFGHVFSMFSFGNALNHLGPKVVNTHAPTGTYHIPGSPTTVRK